ncbi:MAG: hypothetical protein QM778_15605 [Myxococcales bacterium]
MDSQLVLTPSEIDRPTLREFVVSQGGLWQDHLYQGVFERGSASVYACVEPVDPEMHVVPNLRCSLPSWVVLYIGHGQGSQELAGQVADKMVSTWGGCIER